MQIPNKLVYKIESVVEDFFLTWVIGFFSVIFVIIAICAIAFWKVVTIPWEAKRFLIGPRQRWDWWFAWHPVKTVDNADGAVWCWWEPVERYLGTDGFTTYYRPHKKA